MTKKTIMISPAPKLVAFATLDDGDWFRHGPAGKILMKVFHDLKFGCEWNAINLDTGCPLIIEGGEEVIYISHVEWIIK